MKDKPEVCIMWFRRDLRLDDNAALYYALKSGNVIVPVFIFDKNILDDLEDKRDRRVAFIYNALEDMQAILKKRESTLEIYYDTPEQAYRQLLLKYAIKTVYANEDFEQYAIDRDAAVGNLLQQHEAVLKLYKDQVIFSKDEVAKKNGEVYSVFTPYSKTWLAKVNDFYLKSYPTEKDFNQFYKQEAVAFPTLESMGFELTKAPFPPHEFDKQLISKYNKTRDIPGIAGTTRLGIHLRFGTISIRKLVSFTQQHNAVFLKELIWRDFYQMILWQSDAVKKEKAFKPKFDNIEWLNNEDEFKLWREGKTGYPMVDAGMRQLNATGYMHNRVRMITASFLSKHLLIDWRWGEAYFAQKLLDFDYANNNGGWQWSAGTGADPSPYFRVFNPEAQRKKFDKDFTYIKQWVPEFQSPDYKPIVDHQTARQRALKAYKKALGKGEGDDRLELVDDRGESDR